MARTINIKSFFHGSFVALLLAAGTPASAEIAIIANPSLETGKISAEQVAKIFLSSSPVLPNGTRVTPIAQSGDAAITKTFDNKVLHKNEQELRTYWARIIFTGAGKPPIDAENDDDAKKRVADTPAAMGYINASAVDTSVKVILLIP